MKMPKETLKQYKCKSMDSFYPVTNLNNFLTYFLYLQTKADYLRQKFKPWTINVS